MALANWWMILVAAGVVVVAVGIGLALALRSRARTAAGERARIARAERLRALPTFRSALRRRVLGLTGILALGAIATLSAGVVAARPMSSQTIQPVNTSRDIMLCLDVSGSMSEVDVEVLSVFEDLLEGFKGERIGLTIFNSSPVQVFPLTDDYEFIREHLESIRESFDYVDDIPEHWVGTLNGDGASLIGDGLAACALAFDHPDDELQTNFDFHFIIYRRSGMKHLIDVLEALWMRIGPILSELYPNAMPTYAGPHQHEQVLAALRDRDSYALRMAIRMDLIEGGAALVRHLKSSAYTD